MENNQSEVYYKGEKFSVSKNIGIKYIKDNLEDILKDGLDRLEGSDIEKLVKYLPGDIDGLKLNLIDNPNAAKTKIMELLTTENKFIKPVDIFKNMLDNK